MANINWSFADNLQIPAGKYLKWLDPTGVSRNNILGLDTMSNLYINSGKGDIYFNTMTMSGSNNYFNINNTGNSIFNNQVGIGFSNTSNMVSNITLPMFGWVGVNSTQGGHSGYLGLAASSSLLGTSGSKILLYGIDATGGNAGNANIYAGKLGNIQAFTGDNNMIMQILNNGTTNFSPDGSDITVSIASNANIITTPVNISSTVQSNSPTSGALVVAGGIGILGNTYINGTLSINSILGNLNFNNTTISTSYSTGTFYLSGGFGIECSTPASSITAGGAISIAGGLALGKNAIIGGDVTIISTSVSISAVSGSGIFYGGVGINGQTNIRSDQSSQIRIIPVTSNAETSIFFGNQNNYSTNGSWTVGQNTNSVGSTNFGINSEDNGTFITLNNSGQTIVLNKLVSLLNSFIITNNSSDNLITFNDTQGNNTWSIGRIVNNNSDFQISRLSHGNLLGVMLSSDNKTGNITIFGTENSNSNNSGGALTINGGTSIAKDLYIGGNIYIYSGSINFSGNLIQQPSSNLTRNFLNYVTLTTTDAAINSSTGSFITLGGITIQATEDAKSITNGGSILTLGGASIFKSLLVGDTITSSVISTGNLTTINSTHSNIYSTNGVITNITNVNLLTTNSSITNLINTNSTIINMYVSNSSFGTIYSVAGNISQLISNNISTTSLTSSNISSINTVLTNISSVNVTITNLLNSLSVINNLTVGTLLVSSSANLSYNSNTIGNIYTTGGNVGINQAFPNYTLDVNGSTRFSSGLNNAFNFVCTNPNNNAVLTLTNSTQLSSFIGIGGPSNVNSLFSNNLFIQSPNAITFIVNGTNYPMYLATNGNVGINTSVANFTLDINGTLRSQSTVFVDNTVNNISNTTGSNNFSSDITLSNSSRNSIIFNSVGVSPPTFNTRSIGSKLILYPNISSNTLDYSIGTESQSMWFSSPGSNGFKWYNNLTSANMILNSIGLSINSNNSAIYALDINGSGRFTNSILGQYNSNTLGNIFTTGGNVGINNTNPQSTLDITGSGRFTDKLSAIFNSNTLGNIYTTSGNVGINNTHPNQLIEISPITYNSNLTGGIRIGTSNYINNNDSSYRYIDLRLTSDSMNNFRGSIFGTLTGGISSQYEYISFNQGGNISIYSPTIFYDTTSSSNPSIGSVVLTGGLSINSSVNAISKSNGGSLTVGGGGAFSQDVYIGGNLNIGGVIISSVQGSNSFNHLTLTSTDYSVNLSTGSLITFGGISVQSNSNATSSTSGGGITISGGAGIGKDLYVNESIYSKHINSTTASFLTSTISSLLVTNTLNVLNATLGNIYTTNGNVGIGIVNPAFILTIGNSNGSTASGTAFIQASDNPSLGFGAGTNNYMWISAPLQTTGGLLSLGGSGNGTIAPTSGGVININSNNFVGINNTNPAFALDITGVLNLRTTNDSSNFTTGTFVSYGGISISKTTNSTSTTCGGALSVAGGMSVYKDVYIGGTVTSSSDRFLKKNIKLLPSVLDKISNINPIIYNCINDFDTKDYIGFIAQDFEDTFPELIRRENENAYYSLAYDRITALNFKCIKELLDEINKLKIIIKSLN